MNSLSNDPQCGNGAHVRLQFVCLFVFGLTFYRFCTESLIFWVLGNSCEHSWQFRIGKCQMATRPWYANVCLDNVAWPRLWKLLQAFSPVGRTPLPVTGWPTCVRLLIADYVMRQTLPFTQEEKHREDKTFCHDFITPASALVGVRGAGFSAPSSQPLPSQVAGAGRGSAHQQ